jgi:protein phosphatase
LSNIFGKIFKQRQVTAPLEFPTGLEIPQNNEVPTVPIKDEDPEVHRSDLPIQEKKVPQFMVACAQSVGRQREHNEDSFFTLTTNLGTNGFYLPIGLYVVADGMGGHQHGELASGIAVRVLSSQLIKRVFTSLLSPKASLPNDPLQDILDDCFQEAHRTIIKEAPGGGTTLTAILILDDQMSVAHIGDSRAYSITLEGKIQALTRDHSLVMRMIELGHLSVEEAASHPQRNVLYRALGQGEPVSADISTHPLPESGYLLICSDGLWNVISEDEISKIVTSASDLHVISQELVDAANNAGGPDNISVILVRLPE